MSRREIVTVVGVTTAVWLVFSSAWPLIPIRLLVTLVHEAGHALALEAVGGDVDYVIINRHGGGLTSGHLDSPGSTFARVVVSSAGYVGAAVVGGVMLEAATRLRRSRVVVVVLAVAVAAIGLAWVPLRVDPDGASAALTGSGSGDGWFTVVVCTLVVLLLAGLAWQSSVRVRAGVMLALATTLCLASIDDLRQVMDWSARGGHSDAASAAAVTPLSSWMWSVLWLLIGAGACALGLWAALARDESPSAPDIAA